MEATHSEASGTRTAGPPRLVVIDDDDLSREVLLLIAHEAGFKGESFASGNEAVAALTDGASLSVILTDMQMPGLCGAALALELRNVCGPETVLLSMSGSSVPPEELAGYDGFLLKPFSADELKAACDRRSVRAASASVDEALVLNEAVFAHFARSMPSGQVFGLYRMCLDDAAKRLAVMRKACKAQDDSVYRRAAHAIKGGCGMVGAMELAKLAAMMEDDGLPAEHDAAPLDRFLDASARLERMLDDKSRMLDIEARMLDNRATDLQADALAVRL